MWGNNTSTITIISGLDCNIFPCTKGNHYDEIAFCAHFLNNTRIHVFLRKMQALQQRYGMIWKRAARLVLPWCAVVVVGVGGLLLLDTSRNASVLSLVYTEDNGPVKQLQPPLQLVGTDTQQLHVSARFLADTADISLYRFSWYGCIERMEVNAVAIPLDATTRCNGWNGAVFALAPALKAGENTLDIIVTPNKENERLLAFRGFRPSFQNPVVAAKVFLLLITFITVCVFAVIGVFNAGTTGRRLAWVFTVGAVLRLLMAVVSQVGVRTADASGHLEYIRYVLAHTAIPPPQSGWEMFQPPAYYFAAASWMRFTHALGFSGTIADVQALSFLLSITTLALGIYALVKLLPQASYKQDHVLLAAVLFATAPGLALFAPAITNDAGVTVLTFACFALLLSWWRDARQITWLATCCVVALAILTKLNALACAVLLLAAVVARRSMNVSTKKKLVLQLSAILLLACGWYFVLRFFVQGERSLVGNITNLSTEYLVPNTPLHYLIFHPLRVLANPNILNAVEGTGWEYFLEYFFTSAHFGIFLYPNELKNMAQYILLGGMLTFALAAYGLCASRLRGLHTLAVLSAFVFFLVQVTYRVIHPFSFNQDARFSRLLILLLAYFSVQALRHVPVSLRSLCEVTLCTYALVCALFILQLFWLQM